MDLQPNIRPHAAFAISSPNWTKVNRRPRISPTSIRPTLCSIKTPSPNSTNVDTRIIQSLSQRKVVVTGGTGFIGRKLIAALQNANADVSVLSRDPQKAKLLLDPAPTILQYDAETNLLSTAVQDALSSAHVVVNLAGEPVEQTRWTADRKKILWHSRVNGTSKLVRHFQQPHSKPVFISASAVGYYGSSPSQIFTEESAPGTDFLAVLAAAWEKAALGNVDNSRTVVFRIGVVLGNGGGALEKMSTVFKAFLGGVPGGGEQWFSWVHIDDIVRLILHASVDEKWQGVYNATAPQPVRLSRFCSELGRALGRPSWLPVPRQAIEAIYGNEAAQLILAGQQVIPKRTRQNGFIYRYKDVASALQQLTRHDKSKITSK